MFGDDFQPINSSEAQARLDATHRFCTMCGQSMYVKSVSGGGGFDSMTGRPLSVYWAVCRGGNPNRQLRLGDTDEAHDLVFLGFSSDRVR
jgi:hypothetical protein